MFCDEFILVDLRVFDNCKKVCEGCEHVFNLAADMGGMGFIQSNHSVIMYNNTMISFNMIEAARQTGIKRCAPLLALSLQRRVPMSPDCREWLRPGALARMLPCVPAALCAHKSYLQPGC